jgi:hypothetical protein
MAFSPSHTALKRFRSAVDHPHSENTNYLVLGQDID